MRTQRRSTLLKAFAACAAAVLPIALANAQSPNQPDTRPLFMTMRLPIPGGPGRLDSIAYDASDPRAFISSPSTGAVHALTMGIRTAAGGGTAMAPITNLPEPLGVLWVPSLSRLFVACGGDGSVRVFTRDQGALKPMGQVQFTGEAEDLAMDPAGDRVWVGHARSISWFNPEGGAKGEKSVRLLGHPEAIVLDSRPHGEGGRLYATVARPGRPAGGGAAPRPHVAVVDRGTLEVVATWELDGVEGNHALALDEKGERLFVACRHPAKVVVLSTASGEQVASLEAGGDSDGIAWDEKTQRLFVAGGAGGGTIHVYQRRSGDDYALENTISTLAGGSTCLLVPEKRLLLVVVPQVGPDPGALFHYEIRN